MNMNSNGLNNDINFNFNFNGNGNGNGNNDNSLADFETIRKDHDGDDDDDDYVDDSNNNYDYSLNLREDKISNTDIYKRYLNNPNNIINNNINMLNVGQREAPKNLPNEFFVQPQLDNNFINPIIIPIKLKINSNGSTINDCFLYNLKETIITPEIIASTLSLDLDLHKNTESLIITQIKDQIQTFNELINNPNNLIINQFLSNETEFHVILDISCNLGEDFFTDKIEWNLLDTFITPEIYSKTVVSDLGLKPEFENVIAVSVYEEIYKFKKELIENPQQLSQTIDSLPFFNLVISSEVFNNNSNIGGNNSNNGNNNNTDNIVQGLRYDLRKYGEEFSPTIEKLSEWEIEKRETEKERNLRRRKRETLKFAGMR